MKIDPIKFKEIYSIVPRLTIELVIRTDSNTLLTKRAIEPYKDFWHLPGGTYLFGETIDEAIRRICLDEVGVAVESSHNLGYIQYHEEQKYNGYGWAVSLVFLVLPQSQDFKPNWQSSEIRFFKKCPENTIREQKEFLKTYET